jgi:pyruvate,water dikinase
LEDHYRHPLDIEWALDPRGKIYVLQARPLGFTSQESPPAEEAPAPALEQYPVLLRGGASAADGVASGPAFVLKSDHNLPSVPEGAVLIARQTSPRYVPIIGRVRAIVTDIGSVTGHMASVAREFRIPTLVGTGRYRPDSSRPGITVDARNGSSTRAVEERSNRPTLNPMKGSPAYKIMERVLKEIAPLNLLDPQQDNFTPGGCETIHDLIRFVHEMAMQEMFQIGEDLEPGPGIAVRFRSSLPLNLYVVDLGGGLAADAGAREVGLENITSIPFKALLQGMTSEGVEWLGQNKMDWGGFTSLLMESIPAGPQKREKWGISYAVISAKYLEFQFPPGLPLATLDTYCGQNINNYINFYFKGGAADIERRTRRAILVASILKRLGFSVEQKGDRLRGQLKKHDQDLIREKLDLIGRLMGSVRLLDMVLSDDRKIEWFVEEFFKGNYTFQPPASTISPPAEARNSKSET